MDKQPEALLLAEMHEDYELVYRTAKELRRLHSENQELMGALQKIAEHWNKDANYGAMYDACWYMSDTANAALDKHKEQA